MMEKAAGGTPEEKPDEYKKRSAYHYFKKALNVKIQIHAGIHDGHTGSVPVSHSIDAFNMLAKGADKIPEKDRSFILKNRKLPNGYKVLDKDETYGKKQPLLKRKSNNIEFILFEGGHESIATGGLKWLSKQKKE